MTIRSESPPEPEVTESRSSPAAWQPERDPQAKCKHTLPVVTSLWANLRHLVDNKVFSQRNPGYRGYPLGAEESRQPQGECAESKFPIK